MHEKQWAIELARAAAPDEELLAPLQLSAWLAGGSERSELYGSSRSMAGSFSAGELTALLPLIFKGLALGAPAVIAFLTSEFGRAALEGLKTGFSVLEIGKLAHDMIDEKRNAPQAQFEALRLAMQTIEHELRQGGIPAPQAESASLKVMAALLADPNSAARFVSMLREHA